MRTYRFLGASALFGTLVIVPSALAQTAANPAQIESPTQANTAPAGGSIAEVPITQAEERAAGTGEVVVTGSRIRTPNATSTVPITTISAAELTQTARTSIGDVLNDLPQLQNTFSQANSTRFLGTGGLNLLDLRGLGIARTLVLQNGRRHVGSAILSNGVSVDVNSIPTDLIEGVDIVTGAQSAVYGSDAIAGVVNFRLRQNFEGLQLRGQGGISDEGDAGSYFVSLTAGKNFAGGRGNIALNLEYARAEDLFGSGRRAYRQADGFVTNNIDPPGVGAGGNLNFDGIPDQTFFRDLRIGTFSDGGLVSFAGAAPGANSQARCGRDPLGRAYTCNFLFQPGGGLAQQNGTRTGIAGGSPAAPTSQPAGFFIGGNGNTRREGVLLQLLPQVSRYSANLLGHFDVSEAFVPFFEAKYVRIDTRSLGGSGPAFFTGATLNNVIYERPRLDNPFLTPQARAQLTQQALLVANSGINPNGGAFAAAGGRTAAQVQAATVAQINDGSFRFTLRKNLTDLGSRSEEARRETYRFVGGIRGDFNDTWNYELSANYGEFRERTRVLGNVDVQRLGLALDAVSNGAGQIVCGAQLDRLRANAGTSAGAGNDFAGDAANLANDIANCVPINPFGLGGVSDATRNYILRDTVSEGKITQLDILGTVAGDTSKFFNLPGGAVGFSLGGEYRRETNFFAADPVVQAGYTFYNALAAFDPPAFEVKEAFGELRLPILKDTPFFETLAVSGAGRVSDYNNAVGTVFAYNVSGEYAPIRDVRLRANYGRSVRSPNLRESPGATQQSFAPGFTDPCSADNLARGTQFRAANCAAAGRPGDYNYIYVQSLEIQSGGNPALTEERSDSYTYGAVVTPRFAPGLTMSVDYYNIQVRDVITSVSAQNAANNCYDTETIVNNPFCTLFQRVPAGQTGPNGEQAFRIIEGTLLQAPLNFASLRRRGIDANIAYTRTVGSTRLSGNVIYTYNLEASEFLNPLQPDFANNLRGELGFPKNNVQMNLGADFGTFTFDTQLRYLSRMSIGEIENVEAFQDRPPQNLDAFEPAFYPDVFYVGMRFGIDIGDRSNFYIGVDNLTDRLPPLGVTGIGGFAGIYDNIGRRFYAGITARF